jgi:hypothetical protein
MRCHLMRFNLVIIVLNLLLKWHSMAVVADSMFENMLPYSEIDLINQINVANKH